MPERPTLPHSYVLGRKRTRIIAAVIDLIAERDVEATKIADIVGRAGVARATFYAIFSGKDEAVAAALEQTFAEVVAIVRGAAGVRDALLEVVEYVREKPEAARFALVYAPQIDLAAQTATQDALAAALAPSPGIREDFAVGGAWEAVRRHTIERHLDDPGYLLPDLLNFTLTATQSERTPAP